MSKYIKPNVGSVAALSESVPDAKGSLNGGAELAVGNYVPQGPPHAPPAVPSAVVKRLLSLGSHKEQRCVPFVSGVVGVECC